VDARTRLAGAALLERSVGYALGSLAAVTPGRLGWPTPCREWTLDALLSHLDDSVRALTEAADGRVARAAPAPVVADPAARLRRGLAELVGAWTAADRPDLVGLAELRLTAAVVGAVGALELTVHGWDIARACGSDRPVPAALAAELLDLAPLLVAVGDRPGRFDPPVRVPAGAGPAARLLAHLGRDPDGPLVTGGGAGRPPGTPRPASR
jgi:uncharacterized protein (TIGR03086 family)